MTQQEIQELKSRVSIVEYLTSKGIEPQNQSGGDYHYFSPLRDEKTPSFVVSLQKNLFNDFGGIGGDVIRLVQTLERLSFPQALDFLQNFSGSPKTFSLAEKQAQSHEPKTTEIVSVQHLQNMHLIRYVQSRCISFNTASKYLKEVHYKDLKTNRVFYGLGFANDGGGFAIRTQKISRAIEPNGITTIQGTDPTNKALNIFEGFFDFLSALEYYQLSAPTNTSIVLNSVSHINSVKQLTNQVLTINSFLDNDKAGQAAFKQLASHYKSVLNQSEKLHPNHKDFNEYFQTIKHKNQ
jgi:DNA primase